jgi:hypothetical protein
MTKKTKKTLTVMIGKKDNSNVPRNSSLVVKVLHDVTLEVNIEKLTDKQLIIKNIIIKNAFIFL